MEPQRMEESFHYLLLVSQSLLHKQLLASLKETGLTLGQPKVLEYLREHDGANQAEIAKACRIEAASVTSALNRMEAAGLLERRTHPDDRRSFFIFLTPEGLRLAQQVSETFALLEQDAFQGISPTQQQEFLKVFRHIYKNLTQRERE